MKDHTGRAVAVMFAGISFAYIEGSRVALVVGYAVAVSAALIMVFRCRRLKKSGSDDPNCSTVDD